MRSRLAAALAGTCLAALPVSIGLALLPSVGGVILLIVVPFAIPGLLLMAWALHPGIRQT